MSSAAPSSVSLLSPLTMRGLTIPNRIGMSPMCQYSAIDGLANDWHLVHLGSRASGGTGLVMVEATAVTAEGRISPGDMGIWSDEHVAPLARIATFVKSQGSVPGIQLAHAGRKASCDLAWLGGKPLHAPDPRSWQPLAPSAVAFSDDSPVPMALDEAGINSLVDAFIAATKRSLAAGFEFVEIHAAHGYLLHEFLSPLSNMRTDDYGGSLENRMRLLVRVASAVREVIPREMPLLTRISATDWVAGGWDIEQSIELAKSLGEVGVDMIDVSSGAIVPHVKIPVAPGYQVPLAGRIRREASIKTAAVGLITSPEQAQAILDAGDADLILIGRELLREPYWAHQAYEKLGGNSTWPTQYGYAIGRR